MEIVGRDAELARVAAALASLPSGSVRLLVEGEPGIGKTTVWHAGVDAARAQGFRVLETRPSEADASLGYAGLADLVGDVDGEPLDALPPPQRWALDVALLRRASADRAPDARAVFAGFVTLLVSLAAAEPVVVAVDDVQWLDAPSLGAIGFAARRVRNAAVGFFATRRPNGDRARVGERWSDDERIRLGALSPAALHHVIKDRLGWSMPRPTLMRLHRMCGGNAFFALEIARELRGADSLDPHAPWPIPEDVREIVDARVRRLPPAARRELGVAAAASRPTADLLSDDTLRVAAEAGLATVETNGRLRFEHPLYASAIYAGLSPSRRREVHRALAADEAEPEERARHLALTVDGTDEAVAAEVAAAAAHARGRGAPETAGELMERALALTPPTDPAARRSRTFAAATDWFRSGSLDRASTLLEALAEDDDAIRGRALHLLAHIRFRQERLAEAFELLQRAAAEAVDDAALGVLVELDLAYAVISSSLDHEPAAAHTDAALAAARQVDEPMLLAQALSGRAIVDFLRSRGYDEDALAQALELEDADAEATVEMLPTTVAGFLSFYAGRFDDARARLLPLRQRLLDRGRDAELPLLDAHLAWIELWAGNYAVARRFSDEALETAALGRSMTAHALAFAAYVDAHTGDAERARERAQAALGELRGAESCLVFAWSLGALGHVALVTGETVAVCAALEPLTGFFEQKLLVEPTLVEFLPNAIEAHVAAGELGRATRLTELLERSVDAFGREWMRPPAYRCRALVLAAANDLDGALAAIEMALAAHDGAPIPLERARTLLVAGVIERRLRRKARARTFFADALAICEELGAPLWAERARAELERTGLRRRGEVLTTTEERVAELAAAGLTNREIAAAAYMSQKTVEANLSRIYRKLTIRSRAELGVRLTQRL